ncbi:uncharacterized protein [Solanum lycopersicum]|uniref:uncharacterized protein isoform X5 n=1 Tax=Solanum lycopersicum TaxID=4081 RepID=UPI003747F960
MFLLLYICFISSYFPAINPESSSGETVLHPLGSPVPARPKLPAILSIDRKYPRGCHGMRKTKVNLKRLLVTAPQQQNQAKLIHYVATLRELLEQLAKERNPDGLPRISKAKVNEYAENIEYVAAKLAVPTSDMHTSNELEGEISSSGTPKAEGSLNSASEGLRRRFGCS